MPSAKVLESKKAVVAELTERLKNAQAGVIADYRGLTVAQDTELRTKLREAGVEYTRVKNTLTRFAANEVGLEGLDPILHGPTALATSSTDAVAPAKILADYAKTAGRDVYITLEPHLESFDGLHKLVGATFENPYVFADGKAAFLAGADHLAKVIAEIEA